MITLKPSMVTSYFKAFYHAQRRKLWVPGQEYTDRFACSAGAVSRGRNVCFNPNKDVEQTCNLVLRCHNN